MTRTHVILIGLFVLVAGGMFAAAHTSTSVARTETIDVPLNGATRARIDLSIDAGRVALRGLPDGADRALAGLIEVGARERFLGRVDPGEELRVAYQARQRFGISFAGRGPSWDLGVHRELPTVLTVRAGATDGSYDLRGTQVTRFDLDAEVGRQTIHLPRTLHDAAISTEVGRLVLYLPADIAAVVTVDRGVRLIDAGDAFTATGNRFALAGPGDPTEVRVRAEMGAVTLRTY